MMRQDIQDMLHRCQICIEIRDGYVEDVGEWKDHGRKQSYQSLPKQSLTPCNDHQNF